MSFRLRTSVASAWLLSSWMGGNTAFAEPRAQAPRAELAAFSESALGLEGDGFYNHLLGARLDYRAEPRFAVGAGLSYANLKGPAGRASNALLFSQFEWRPPLAGKTTLPTRFAAGYLPKNGPWLKAAVGLGQPLGDTQVLTLELLAPALWIVQGQPVWSLDASIEVAVGW